MEYSRQDIKRDRFEEFIVNSVEWVKANQNLAMTIGGTILGVILLSAFIIFRLHTLNSTANERLAIAESQLFGGQPAQGVAMLDDIISKFNKTDIVMQAAIVKTNFMLYQKEYQKAEDTIKPMILRKSPKVLLPSAYHLLAAAQENLGKYDDALKTSSDFLAKFPDSYLSPKVYENIARLYEIKGSFQDAASVYEKIASLYPQTGFAQRAQERLGLISKVAQQQAQQKIPQIPMQQ